MDRKKLLMRAMLQKSLAAFIEKSYLTIDRSQNYVANWHIKVLAEHLALVEAGYITRLIVNIPPRSLKSVCASVAFPAWVLGRNPSKRVICVSYSDELASKHARDCRSVMDSEWYREAFPKTRINPHKRTETEFETTANGYRVSTSTGGTLTGRGGSLIIIDDPLKPQDALSATKRTGTNQWFDNTLYSRLDNKETDCIVIVMQRVNIDDLVAHVQKNEEWIVLNLPAIAVEDEEFDFYGRIYGRRKGEALNPALESLESLERTRKNIGTYNFSTQYQQEPLPEHGHIINWNWFQRYEELPLRERADRVFQSWDTAMTAHDGSDYSVCITMLKKKKVYYIMDIYRAKLDFPSLKKKIKEMKERFAADSVLIEDKGTGTGMIQQLRTEGLRAIPYQPEGSKAERMVAQSSLIEEGSVLLPKEAKWLEGLRAEIISFPHGRHDDQVDALSQLLH